MSNTAKNRLKYALSKGITSFVCDRKKNFRIEVADYTDNLMLIPTHFPVLSPPSRNQRKDTMPTIPNNSSPVVRPNKGVISFPLLKGHLDFAERCYIWGIHYL